MVPGSDNAQLRDNNSNTAGADSANPAFFLTNGDAPRPASIQVRCMRDYFLGSGSRALISSIWSFKVQ